MQLRGSDGSGFALTIIDYEFPDITHNKWDANWLFIEVDISHPHGTWKAQCLCALTWDMTRLVGWLEHAAQGQPLDYDWVPLELCLTFQIYRRNYLGIYHRDYLRIFFGVGLRPEWNLSRRKLWEQFPLAEIDLYQAAKDLQRQLESFPRRGPA